MTRLGGHGAFGGVHVVATHLLSGVAIRADHHDDRTGRSKGRHLLADRRYRAHSPSGRCQDPHPGQFAPALNRRKRMELVTTKTLDSDIANPAISGLRWPVAANGIAATL